MKSGLGAILVFWVATSCALVVNRPKVETTTASVRLGRSRSPYDGLRVEIEAFDEKHNLHLLPTSSPLSVDFRFQRTTRGDDGRLIIEDAEEADESVSDLYHDPETGSVVSIEGENVEGFITPTLSLQAAHDGTHKATRQISPIPEEGDMVNDYMKVPDGVLRGHTSSNGADTRGPVSVSPEVYVVVDSQLSSILGSNKKVKTYLSVFWNAVNQRFATMSDPKVKLVLAGALIIRDPADEPFIESNILLQNYIHGENTLSSVSDWLFEYKDTLPQYDVAYLLTGKDMADVASSTIQEGLAGIAWRGAACVVATANKRSFNTAVGEDQGANYVGVMTATHEVAHNLGSPHDGKDGAESCSWDDGYIMSYVTGKSNKLFFSSCSKKQMKDYMMSSDAACLKKENVGEKISLSSKLPGELITMDEQCQKSTGKSDAYASKSVDENSLCFALVCQWQVKEGYTTWTYTRTSGRPALEGSPCRGGGQCINGKCQ